MKIGILGSGLMGGKLGILFTRAGHDVVFSYARSDEKLKQLANDAKGKARAGTPEEAARDADAVLLAVHWLRMDDVLKQAGDLSGKVVINCSLPMNADDSGLVIDRSRVPGRTVRTLAGRLQRRVIRARRASGSTRTARPASVTTTDSRPDNASVPLTTKSMVEAL